MRVDVLPDHGEREEDKEDVEEAARPVTVSREPLSVHELLSSDRHQCDIFSESKILDFFREIIK